MNTIKPILMVLVLFFSVFAGSANAVTVRVVEGGTVGLSPGTGYFAGIVTLDIDGVKYPAMSISWEYGLLDNQGWQTDYTPWEGVLYTQNEITPTNVRYSPEEYSMASKFFLDGMLGYSPADPLWAASYNEMMWDVLSGIDLWYYANMEYPETGSGVTLHDVYLSEVATGLDPNTVYDFMGILQTPVRSVREFAVFNVPSVPVPPAVWLFSSGLIGLVGVARRRK